MKCLNQMRERETLELIPSESGAFLGHPGGRIFSSHVIAIMSWPPDVVN